MEACTINWQRQEQSLCVETLKCLEDKTATWEPQGESTTAYAKMLDKNLGNINWNDPAVQIERLIRGLNPWPSAYTHWNDKVIKLWQADVVEDNTDQGAGTIVKVEKDSFYVQTGEGLLKIEELQLQGKKRMDAGAFLRGNHLGIWRNSKKMLRKYEKTCFCVFFIYNTPKG